MKYQGTVGYIGERVFRGTKYFSFTLKGVEGFFRLGTNKPAFKNNGYVEFEADEKLNVIGEVKSVAERAPEPATLSSSNTGASTGSNTKSVGIGVAVNYREQADAVRQRSIHFQSAAKLAAEVAQFIVAQEAIKIPQTPAKKMGAILALVDELTNRYFKQFEAGKTDIEPETKTEQEEATEAEEGPYDNE